MIHALSWSGGKDSTLALHRAVHEGLAVRYLFNIFEGESGRLRFHGVQHELIRDQAEALGLELVQRHTEPGDYEAALGRALDDLQSRGVQGVVFGNVHLEDIRAWYEERTTGRGFEHREPLWGADPADVVDEFVEEGYRARVVSVNQELGNEEWLGRDLDRSLADELKQTEGIDPAGERGEYHTFVYDGPLFRHPVAFETGETFEREGHRFLDLARAADTEPHRD